jgi:hypothetical protein
MTDIYTHPLLTNIGQKAVETDLYTQHFNNAQVEIMGESPYLNARDAGIELVLTKKHKIDAIHLYNGTLEGFCRYPGPFPLDINFEMTRAQIRNKLGTPAMSIEPGGIGLMAIEHAFDRYENETYYIRFEFETGNGGVRLITFGQA